MATDMTLASNNTVSQKLSYTSGPTDKTLWTVTLGALAEIQAEVFGDRTALIFPWQNERRTYREFFLRSNTIAKSLLESGLQHGDCVGIFAGNCVSYLEVFLGASFIGCPVVVLNSNYTPAELDFTVGYSGEQNLGILSLLMLLMSFTRMQAPLHRTVPWAQSRLDTASAETNAKSTWRSADRLGRQEVRTADECKRCDFQSFLRQRRNKPNVGSRPCC
jgi:acyl-CoA synthetase (AMP-forming)/AMP-acid ligase II